MLVTVSGTSVSRRGAEIALVLAQASRGSVTALHEWHADHTICW
jgi:hypothetical protein